MDLRVTPQLLINNALARSTVLGSQLSKLQEQASTGKRLLAPSDAPADIGPLLANKAQDLRLETYLSTIAASRALLDQSVSSLTDAGNILTQARGLALEASNATNTPDALLSMAQEVDHLLQRLLDLANTQQHELYLYAGAANQTKPFAVTLDSQGRPQTVVYQGSDQRGVMPVSPRDTIATYYTGNEVFQARQRGVTLFNGATGAGAGTGTDSATGLGALLVTHTATSYAGASGVLAGTGSAAGDTILGPAGAHQLTIVDTSGTGAFGTVSLNGGPPVNFTSADGNLQVAGPLGESVFVDTTAITPAFNGTVNITAAGALSVDGGASFTPIDFSPNQVIVNSATGAVTNVASTTIRRTGSEQLDYQGAFDAFQVLMTLRDDLRNTRGLPEHQQLQTISRRIQELDRAKGSVLQIVGEQAAGLQSLEDRAAQVQDAQLAVKKMVSNLEDADLTQVLLRMQTQENLLRAMLASTMNLLDVSILDYF